MFEGIYRSEQPAGSDHQVPAGDPREVREEFPYPGGALRAGRGGAVRRGRVPAGVAGPPPGAGHGGRVRAAGGPGPRADPPGETGERAAEQRRVREGYGRRTARRQSTCQSISHNSSNK